MTTITSPYPSAPAQPLSYATIPPRAVEALQGFMQGERPDIDARVERFRHVQPRAPDTDGDTEVLDGVTFRHRFIAVPGDFRRVTYHVVEAGPQDGEPVLLLHGIPDSWYQWRHVMVALAGRYRLIAPDLKGYGQSEKRPGDYAYAGTAEELVRLLGALGVDRFNLVSHDRGTLPADFIAARHAFRVLRYVRGEQHLAHYHPMLSPQEHIFAHSGPMRDPVKFVVWGYGWACSRPVSDEDLARTIQEYSYPGIADAVPRYFTGSTFTSEWIERCTTLMAAWRAPVLIMEGLHSRTQPHELYEDAWRYMPNVLSVDIALIDAGHFWTLEAPQQASEAIANFLAATPAFDPQAWLAGLAS